MSSSNLAAGIRHLRSKLAQQCRHEDSDEQLLHAFTSRRDDSAFAVLVRRHGPMVLHVCRRVLGHEQDAEDAFQAAFLVLARNAASLRDKKSLTGFLHGIAYRTAMKAKQSAARRRKYEGLAPSRPSVDPADDVSWREVRTRLDEEIANLPEAHRSVFVLCCLEDLSQAEAGHRLGLKERTVSYRLAAARKTLAQRLARRGVELTAVLAATGLAAQSASALPPMLMATTLEAALARVAGEGTAGIVSASVAELVKGMATAMMVSKVKIATVLLLSATLLAGAGVWTCRRLATSQPAEPQAEQTRSALAARKKHQTTQDDKGKDGVVSGRVVDPDGKPVRGAKLAFTYGLLEKIPHKIWAVSDGDGRFAFTMPQQVADKRDTKKSRKDTFIVAAAEGYGFAAARLDNLGANGLTLRLVKDDEPIRGRIIDLQGKPIAGVHVRIENHTLVTSKKSDLTDWLAHLKASKENHRNVRWWDYWTQLYSPAFDLLFSPVTTGVDGRFEMKGIGRERLAQLRIEGPTIATQKIQVTTRAVETIQLPEEREFPKGPMVTYYGADFELLAAPSRPIIGVVRDKDTGKPLAGVAVETTRVYNQSGFLKTTTDKDGRYRLEGLPKGDGYEIAARADDWVIWPGKENQKQLPYLAAVKKVDNPLGLEPVTIDFALKRGVWVKGRVTEENSGKPLDANIEYFCFSGNPNAKEIAFRGSGYNHRFSREDGLFQIPVLPGHGLIAVRAYQDHFIMGVGADKIKGPRDRDQSEVFITAPYLCYSGNFHTLVEIEPKSGEESIACDVVLDPGRSLKGTVCDSDGKPLAGTRIAGLKDMGYWEENGIANFTMQSLKPNKPRLLQFMNESQKLSGYVILKGDEKGSIQVQLKRSGALTGRLLTPLGNPVDSLRVNCHTEVKYEGRTLDSAALTVYPGKDGRFRIEGLIAGLKYEVSVSRSNVRETISGGNPKDLTIRTGETKDLGDLTVKPRE